MIPISKLIRGRTVKLVSGWNSVVDQWQSLISRYASALQAELC